MIKVSPKVYLVASTIVRDGLDDFLDDIGQSDWSSNANSHSDLLIEVGGRLCYRSWKPYDGSEGTNKNVTRVREDNTQYVQNIISSSHGSVLEHSNISLIFHNVSRVFTHELVRHRAGMAYSQESLRYVRLDQLKFWLPEEIEKHKDLKDFYNSTVQHLEQIQSALNQIVNLDSMSFDDKKKWTSRFRRLAPIGLATTILVTGNLRAWRHIVNMRGNKHAEEEINLVMNQVVPILKEFSPAVFHDLEKTPEGWQYKLNAKP
jgi:thymidylate synthase (FAD)